jgi:hypothetical protein
MRLDEFDELDRLVPTEKPAKVFLKALPKMAVDEEGRKSVTFTYKDQVKEAEASFIIFDPFKQKEDLNVKLKRANFSKALAIYGAMMPPAKYEEFKKTDFKDFQEFHDRGLKDFDENALAIPIDLVFGYNKNTGYLDLPTFGSFISTPHRERNLVFDPNALSLKPVERKNGKGQSNVANADDDDQDI